MTSLKGVGSRGFCFPGRSFCACSVMEGGRYPGRYSFGTEEGGAISITFLLSGVCWNEVINVGETQRCGPAGDLKISAAYMSV